MCGGVAAAGSRRSRRSSREQEEQEEQEEERLTVRFLARAGWMTLAARAALFS